MRPVSLAIQRFLGIESVSLNFPAQLFVMVGPNGAGKSSLLEALYYALFGKGIRTERGKKDLLHRAYPDESFRVELVFDLADSWYRVTREYAPKRGSTVVLERRFGQNWEPVCTGEQAVNQEIIRLTGLDGETFRWSVFLPQGETLNFVEATPARRFKILSSLFGLDVLDRVRELAKDQLERLEAILLPARQRREIVSREKIAETLNQRLDALIEYQKKRSDLEQEIGVMEKTIGQLTSWIDLARTVSKNQQKAALLFQQHREAEAKAELDRKISASLRIASGAYSLWRAAADALRQVSAELNDRLQKNQEIQRTLDHTSRSFEQGAGPEKKLEERLKQLTHYRDRLDREARPVAGELDRLHERLIVFDQELTRLGSEEKSQRETGVREARERDRIVARLEAGREDCIRMDSVVADLTRVVHQGEPMQKELESLTRDVNRVRQEWQGTAQELKAFRASEKELNRSLSQCTSQRDALRLEKEAMETSHREAVRNFAVHELHGKWVETGICPVCQSQASPPPMWVEEGEPVSMRVQEKRYRDFQYQLNRLETQCIQGTSRRDSVQERIRETSDRLQALAEQGQSLEQSRRRLEHALIELGRSVLGDSYQSWLSIMDRLKREQAELEQKKAARGSLEKKLVTQEEKLRGIREQLNSLRVRQEESQREKEAMVFRWRDREGKLGEVLAGINLSRTEYPHAQAAFHDYWHRCCAAHEEASREHSRISADRIRLREQMASLHRRRQEMEKEEHELWKQHSVRQAEEREKRQSFRASLTEHGLDQETFNRLKTRKVEGWQEKTIRLTGEIEALNETIREDEEILQTGTRRWGFDRTTAGDRLIEEQARLDRARREGGDIREKSGALNQEIDQLRQKKEELFVLNQTINRVTEEREVHRRLKEALEVRGFKNYLLGLLLKELEKESSAFLWALSEGRYRLTVHMSGGETEIMVLDERFGGTPRSPVECSGGEKTLIALSLSLALSRIRLRDAGRGEAACLFIDEGFSPLDRDHLGLVADAVLRLGCDGKMVGVVTHDPQFAALFPVHLEVAGDRVEWKKNQ